MTKIKIAIALLVVLNAAARAISIFIPPDHIHPSWILFVPIMLVAFCAIAIRSNQAVKSLLVLSGAVLCLGTMIYWDSLRSNLLFSYQVLGLVANYSPIFESIVLTSSLALILMEDKSKRQAVHLLA